MKHKILKIILKCLLIVSIIAIIGVLSYFLLKWLGFTTKDDFIRLKEQLGDTFLFWGLITLLQAFQVVFIPISNQIITIPMVVIFTDDLWKVFLSSWVGIVIGSIALYFIGRYGGKKLIAWVLGDKEQAEKCSNFIGKSRFFYPVGMLIPFIPDDILTTLAGTSKFNFLYVLVVVIITRGICVAGSVFGIGKLMYYWWGWVIIAVFFSIMILLTIYLFKITNKKEQK